MSIPVELAALAEAVTTYGPAGFFLTTGEDGRAHVSHVSVSWRGDTLVLGAGCSTVRNVIERPATVLLWPPIEPGGYSLIVDVVARIEGDQAVCEPQRAVLHRPAPVVTSDPDACGQDCRPL